MIRLLWLGPIELLCEVTKTRGRFQRLPPPPWHTCRSLAVARSCPIFAPSSASCSQLRRKDRFTTSFGPYQSLPRWIMEILFFNRLPTVPNLRSNVACVCNSLQLCLWVGILVKFLLFHSVGVHCSLRSSSFSVFNHYKPLLGLWAVFGTCVCGIARRNSMKYFPLVSVHRLWV